MQNFVLLRFTFFLEKFTIISYDLGKATCFV